MIRLRPATPDDVQRLARIWHEGWWDAHPFLAEKLGAFRALESFVERIAPRIADTTVAEADGAVAGFAVVVGDELEQLYVDRNQRGRGTARELIQHAERRVAGRGFTTIWLAVATENHRAQAFYRKSGWRATAVFDYPAETASGPVPVPCQRFERRLQET